LYGEEKDLVKSIEMFEKSYGIRLDKELRGFGTSTTAMRLGSAYVSNGEQRKGIDVFLKALGIFQATPNTESAMIINVCNKIGAAYEALGDYDKAVEYYNEALETKLAQLGPGDDADNHETIYSHLQVIEEKDENTAEPLVKEKCVPPSAPAPAQQMMSEPARPNAKDPAHLALPEYNFLGTRHLMKGEVGKAMDYFRKALEHNLATVGPNHLDTAKSLGNIAKAYQEKKQYSKSLEYYQKAFGLYTTLRDPMHPDNDGLYANMGLVYSFMADYDNAMKYAQMTIDILNATHGINHPDSAKAHVNIGVAAMRKGDFALSLEHHEKALKIRIISLGPTHPETTTSHGEIGSMHLRMEKYENALEAFSKAYDNCIATFGTHHPVTVEYQVQTGLCYMRLGQNAKAKTHMTEAIKVLTKMFGAQDSRVRLVRSYLKKL
jgi:tetratricopeptide (TPR) repeat protein